MLPAISTESFSESLPPLRVTPTMKRQIEAIARQSVATNVSDHMRYALRLYIEANTPITEAEARTMEAQPL